VVANFVTATYGPIVIFGLSVAPGTFIIGATFILRDFVQNRYGRTNAYKSILGALLISAAMSYFNGDLLAIVLASGLAFAVSESIDTEIFTRIKTTFANRIMLSGIVGGLFDSTLFVVIGLSPIGAGFLPWSTMPTAILGQWLVKSVLQLIGAGLVNLKAGD